MPISRDARMDRRRRFLRDNVDDASQSSPSQRRQTRKADSAEASADSSTGASATKRTAGYSQDVRRTCSQRLVQLIPVRRRSFAVVIFVSLLVPAMLLAAHYWIYVRGVPWYGHPLALTLDASHPRSIAAWLSSQLWLLCLGATVLTFQLRRHKLDDYNGEYRLWFWLVLTCLIASIDATTKITDLFGMALDGWSQVNLGWSGPAVVQATLAVLIAMLGLRLCTELRSVPTSLVFWLVGLVAWAGSAALGRDEFKIELSLQFRIWLSSALWLGGLTAMWLSALAYLRNTYLEAQRRFLSRGRLAGSGLPLSQRLRGAIPSLPSFRSNSSEDSQEEMADPPAETSRWGLPAFMRRKSELAQEPTPDQAGTRSKDRSSSKRESRPKPSRNPDPIQSTTSDSAPNSDETSTESEKRRGLGGFLKRSTSAPDNAASDSDATPAAAEKDSKSKTGWSSWLRKPKDDGQAEEFRKLKSDAKTSGTTSSQSAQPSKEKSAEGQTKRRWIPGFSRTKETNEQEPRTKPSSTSQPAAGGIFSKIRMPKFKLPSLRLPPPDESSGQAATSERKTRPVDTNRPLPNTQSNRQVNSGGGQAESVDDDNSRPLSKAERKRLRRMQQQEKRAA
jgi:hypothetical protein